MGAPANNIRYLAVTIQPTDRNRVRVLLLGMSLLMLCGLLAVRSVGVIRARAPKTASAVGPSGVSLARLSDEISVHAAGRGNPWINLSDGREVITPYSGPAELTQVLEQNQARPLSLCSADFDEDGVPDLMSGYAGPSGGIVTLLRGNVDSIYPNAPEAKQRRAEGNFTDAPFLSPAFVFGVPESADFVGAGDFDGDSHWDVVAAARGSNKLYLLSGDGKGGLLRTKQIDLPGDVTAMVVGEINRRDGLDDIVVGISVGQRSKVLVFEGPEGALRANPENFEVPGYATSLALGQLDDSYEMDLAVAAGRDLLIIHGRDRKRSLDKIRQAKVRAAAISRRSFPFRVKSIAIGDFTGGHRSEIALLSNHGKVQVVGSRGLNKRTDGGLRTWQVRSTVSLLAPARLLIPARISSRPADELVVVDSANHHLQIVTSSSAGDIQAQSIGAARGPGVSASLDAQSAPEAVLPMRLNGDALSDLVMLKAHQAAPIVAITQPLATVTVNSVTDVADGDTSSIANLISNPGSDGVISLREAITAANNSAGADTINFSIGTGTQTISPTSPLPTITDPVSIDGTTQAGFGGNPIIELNGTSAGVGAGLLITAGSSTVRGLVINRFNSEGNQLNGTGIFLATNGGNFIEGNFIGTNTGGSAGLGNRVGVGIVFADNNVIGGTTVSARNIISGNPFNVDIFGFASHATGNQVKGNFIGPDANGTAALPSSLNGIFIEGASNNTVGGTASGARNIISDGSLLGSGVAIGLVGADGNIVQSNFIGTDVNGTAAIGFAVGVGISQDNNTIGGTVPSARNIVSGNDLDGIFVGNGSAILVQGNFVGTDVTGNTALGNRRSGVTIHGTDNTVGGASEREGNIIAFNTNGVIIDDSSLGPSTRNVASHNFIYSNEESLVLILRLLELLRTTHKTQIPGPIIYRTSLC